MFYNRSCVTQRSMPFWCVNSPLADPFGGGVMSKLTPLQTAEIIAWAGREGYIEATSYHDDDLVPWDPENPEDDLDKSSQTYAQLAAIKDTITAAGLEFNASICNLHGHAMFRNGGLCNPDPAIRRLAQLKVERTLRIGQFLNARYFVYWVARDGFEVPVITQWDRVYDFLAEGLNHVTDYIAEKNMTNYIGATVEPKPNEPRGQMFLPTSGHAAGFILGKLRKPDFWGVNPELLQHESMALMNAVMTVGYLVSLNKLKFLHFGSQIKAQFDNDFPPLVGPEGLKETVMLFHALNQLKWQGVVEYDCHMLRAEGTPADAVNSRKQFIIDCTTALAMTLEMAERIQVPTDYPSQSAADLAGIRQMCALDNVRITR